MDANIWYYRAMKILLLTIGKTKHSWCREGEEYYIKRLQPFCDFGKKELPEEKILPSVDEQEIQKREGERLLAAVPSGFVPIALDPCGKQMDSPELAESLRLLRDQEGGKVCFLIGGALGLSEEVRQKAAKSISFSAMTFPHDIFRIFVIEQLYRSFTILSGKQYHK